MLMRRVNVVGTSGSGKTTFARELARQLGVPYIELDAIRHQAGWVELPDELFRERLALATAGDGWVVDGNYGGIGAREIVWPRADTLVWLDTPLLVNLWRVTQRSMRRMLTREELWNGNRETFANFFLSRHSLFIWALRSHGRKRRELPLLLTCPEYAHLRVFRLRQPREARRWLATVAPAGG